MTDTVSIYSDISPWPCFFSIFVSSHMYPENPTRNRTPNLFRPKYPWYLLLPHQTASCHPEITNSWCSSCPCTLTNSFSVGLLQQCARRPSRITWSTVYSRFYGRQHVLFFNYQREVMPWSGCRLNSTGWYIHTDYTTKSVSYRTSVCMDWLHHTCQHD